jgi:hypothetical protein
MNNFKDLLNIPEYWKSERFLSLKNFDNEEWTDINEYEGMYLVSNYGRVKSLIEHNGTYDRILKQAKGGRGYLIIGISKNKKCKSVTVHRLVAFAFIPNPLSKKTVNHKYGIKIDNRASELEWNTYKENNNHAWKNGLNDVKHFFKKIYCPELNKEFQSITEASRKLGIINSSISRCCNGKLKSAGKAIINGVETRLTWRYVG